MAGAVTPASGLFDAAVRRGLNNQVWPCRQKARRSHDLHEPASTKIWTRLEATHFRNRNYASHADGVSLTDPPAVLVLCQSFNPGSRPRQYADSEPSPPRRANPVHLVPIPNSARKIPASLARELPGHAVEHIGFPALRGGAQSVARQIPIIFPNCREFGQPVSCADSSRRRDHRSRSRPVQCFTMSEFVGAPNDPSNLRQRWLETTNPAVPRGC
jgi:hypothetical protein